MYFHYCAYVFKGAKRIMKNNFRNLLISALNAIGYQNA